MLCCWCCVVAAGCFGPPKRVAVWKGNGTPAISQKSGLVKDYFIWPDGWIWCGGFLPRSMDFWLRKQTLVTLTCVCFFGGYFFTMGFITIKPTIWGMFLIFSSMFRRQSPHHRLVGGESATLGDLRGMNHQCLCANNNFYH